MLGWEFPPFFAGGVGVVSRALTRALAGFGTEITLVLPKASGHVRADDLDLRVAPPLRAGVQFLPVPGLLQPYESPVAFTRRTTAAIASALPTETGADPESESLGATPSPVYGGDLLDEVVRFGARVAAMVASEGVGFDVIHAHDWTAFHAGLVLKRLTGRPLVVHVHITDFDKSGGEHADPRVYAFERAGLDGADRVIAVSRRTRDACVRRYGTEPSRIRVVHNAAEPVGESEEASVRATTPVLRGAGPVVLFVGRCRARCPRCLPGGRSVGPVLRRCPLQVGIASAPA